MLQTLAGGVPGEQAAIIATTTPPHQLHLHGDTPTAALYRSVVMSQAGHNGTEAAN